MVTKSNWGGAQRYVFNLATGLPNEYEPIVAFGPAPDTNEPGFLAEKLGAAGIKTVYVRELARNVGLSDWHAFFALLRVVRLERPTIVHINSSKAAGLGALAARIAGTPRIIFTAHGWPFAEERPLWWRGPVWLFSWLTALLSHRVICVSEADLHRARRMPFIAGRTQLAHNGIVMPSVLPRDEARAQVVSPADLSAHGRDLWVVSTGELTANKGYHAAIEAISSYARGSERPIFYCITSEGADRAAIERHIIAAGLTDRIRLLGFIPDAERFLSAFDIFFMPSRKEGLPYALLEAGAAGLAVVASSVGGIPEVIRDGENGILCPSGDIGAYARALGSLAHDGALRERLGSALKARIAEKFSRDQMIRATLAVYE